MTTSYTAGLQEDLESLAELGPGNEAVEAAARRLSRALLASATTRLLDVMTRAALTLTSNLPQGHIEVRMVGPDPELVYVEEDTPVALRAPAEDPTTARITLRLPQRLKGAIESAAAREGMSVNTWVIRALERSTSIGSVHVGSRLRGFARS